jgi:hypothetical protein
MDERERLFFCVENLMEIVENAHIQKRFSSNKTFFHDVSLQSVSSKQTVTMSESAVSGN